MIAIKAAQVAARNLLPDLYLLVESLDRRVPHIERVGETRIAISCTSSSSNLLGILLPFHGTGERFTFHQNSCMWFLAVSFSSFLLLEEGFLHAFC